VHRVNNLFAGQKWDRTVAIPTCTKDEVCTLVQGRATVIAVTSIRE